MTPVAGSTERRRAEAARAVVARHFGPDEAPAGLVTDVYHALEAAETRGFGDAVAIFRRETAA
jgi:hypothetical protein